MAYKKVLAFDIGIKNLAFCVLEQDKQVLALSNCSLVEPVASITCTSCKLKASFCVQDAPYCKRHVPKTHKILAELSKAKLPANKILKELVKTHECKAEGVSNEKLLHALATKFALPLAQPKEVNASKMSLETLHDALREFAQEQWHLFKGCTHVLLENQPAFKNPHMKSVQVLLFAVLREAYLSHGEAPVYRFVHAKKKVEDAEKGDAGYAERKSKSEDRLKAAFDGGQVVNPTLYQAWASAKKKSDMADALCMTLDA